MDTAIEVGDKVTVTPKSGEAYTGYVRGTHETGYTLWMDIDAKDEGGVRTVHTSGTGTKPTASETRRGSSSADASVNAEAK